MSSSPCSKQQVSKHSTQCVPLQENTSEVAPRSFASALAEKVDREELKSQAFHQVGAPLLVASIKGCVMGTYELIQTRCTEGGFEKSPPPPLLGGEHFGQLGIEDDHLCPMNSLIQRWQNQGGGGDF